MKKLLITNILIFQLISLFSQSILSGRIDYTKFDNKQFDSLMLDEINSRRKEMNLQAFQFDTICHQIANFQSKVMIQLNSTDQTNNIEVDGVTLRSPRERYDYFNMLNQVTNSELKHLESELVTGIRVGLNSRTFTYKTLAQFVLDNFMDEDINTELYRNYGTMEIFSAFSTEIKADEYMNNIYITCLIMSKS